MCILSPPNNLTSGRNISLPHPIFLFILFLVNSGTGTTKGSFARRKRLPSNSTTCRRPRCPCPHPPSSRRRRPQATLTCGGCEKMPSARIPFSVVRTGRLCSPVRALVLRAPPPSSTLGRCGCCGRRGTLTYLSQAPASAALLKAPTFGACPCSGKTPGCAMPTCLASLPFLTALSFSLLLISLSFLFLCLYLFLCEYLYI